MEQEAVIYQSVPDPKLQSKLFTNWTTNDKIVAGIFGLVFLASFVWTDFWSALIILSLGCFALFRRPRGYGRFYSEIYSDIVSWYIDTVLDGVLYSAEPVGNRLVQWLRSRRSAIPFKLTQVSATIDGKKERFGLLQQTDQAFDHLYIVASGASFSNLDVNHQAQAVNLLANITNDAVNRSELKVGMAYLRMTSPYDVTEFASDMREYMNPIVMYPERFNLDTDTNDWVEWSQQNAEQVREKLIEEGVANNWYVIVVTIKRGLKRRAARKSRLSDKQLSAQPIIELGRSLVQNLRDNATLEMHDVHVLGLAELAYLVRSSWDVVGIHDYRRDRMNGLVPTTDEEIEAFVEKNKNPKTGEVRGLDAYLRAWPEKLIATSSKHSYIRMDDNYISTLRVTELPRRVRADQFMSLHYRVPRGIWTRSAMVGLAVSGATETNQLVISQSFFANVNGAFNQNNVVEHPNVTNRRRLLQEQAEQMSAHSISQHFNMLQTIVAPSEDDLISQRRDVKGKIETPGFPSDIVKTSFRQLPAAMSGMLAANRL